MVHLGLAGHVGVMTVITEQFSWSSIADSCDVVITKFQKLKRQKTN